MSRPSETEPDSQSTAERLAGLKTPARGGARRAGADRGRQLLRRQLPAVLVLDAGRRPGGRRPARATRPRHAARALLPHPVLPQALPFLLLPRLHRQERGRDQSLPRRRDPRVRDLCEQTVPRRAQTEVCVFRWRDPELPLGVAVARSDQPDEGPDAVGRGRGGRVRVRAGHAQREETREHPRPRRDAAEPRRGKLRRPHPRAQRSRAPLQRDRARLPLRQIPRLPADQHRPDRRHDGRDRGQLEALHREGDRTRSRVRDHLPDGGALQHRPSTRR